MSQSFGWVFSVVVGERQYWHKNPFLRGWLAYLGGAESSLSRRKKLAIILVFALIELGNNDRFRDRAHRL